LVKNALKNSILGTVEDVTDIQHFLSALDNSFLIIKTSVIELLTPFQGNCLKDGFQNNQKKYCRTVIMLITS